MNTQVGSPKDNSITWIMLGIAAFTVSTLLLLLGKKWRFARVSGGFALAFVEKWQETRAKKFLQRFLAKAAEAT